MKKLLALGGLLLPAAFLAAAPRLIPVNTFNTSLILETDSASAPSLLYYGPAVSGDLGQVVAALPEGERWAAYPVFGNYPEGESALSLTMPDGNMTLDLRPAGEPRVEVDNNGNTVTSIPLADRYYPVGVTLNYRAFPKEDVIETWVEIANNGKKPLRLDRFESGAVPFRGTDAWMTSLYGTWANEGRVNNEPLTPGMKVIQNKDGVRNSHTSHAEVMLSLDGRPSETSGRVIGAALVYGGNYRLRVCSDDHGRHQFFAGIHPDESSYRLMPGEIFTTPLLALTFSDSGLGPVSRNFHRWGRLYHMTHGTEVNPILLNSWEGVYFNIDEPKMAAMMKDIADMGGELFVMDDGWFGRRDDDSSSLGDWEVDTRKLPNGIGGLTDVARRNGIKFGIWIEPEMTNSNSELYRKHPDWIIKAANRDIVEGRGGTQLVLDLSNPEVQDFIYNMVDTLLTNNPEIAYVKWDANAPVMQYGSQYLSADRQSELSIRYHRGFKSIMERIRAKHPEVAIQACASGGGRANWGVLEDFDEFWVSDNTDAFQRLAAQWGTSYFFPAMAMGSHISAVPNHTTFRVVPLKFRCDVAMTGRLGMEIQPRDMSEEERDFCRRVIETYKGVRDVVQLGDLYRLVSPFENRGVVSLMYVSPVKDKAVYYWFRTNNDYSAPLVTRPLMQGLDPEAYYKVTELNAVDLRPLPCEGKVFSGKFLMDNGLEMRPSHDLAWGKKTDYCSRVLLLEKQRITPPLCDSGPRWGRTINDRRTFSHDERYDRNHSSVNRGLFLSCGSLQERI